MKKHVYLYVCMYIHLHKSFCFSLIIQKGVCCCKKKKRQSVVNEVCKVGGGLTGGRSTYIHIHIGLVHVLDLFCFKHWQAVKYYWNACPASSNMFVLIENTQH